jgi:ABC-type molybdate transport system substrate-binding protein
MEALAELMVYVDFVKSPLRGLKKLLGLYRPVKSGKKKYWRLYDGRLHQAVTRLAMAYYKTKPNGRQCWQLIQQIKQLLTTNQTPG